MNWLRELADNATPGPWEWDGVQYVISAEVAEEVAQTWERDARLIALAPDLARLCAEMAEELEDIAESLGEGRAPKWKREMLANHARIALAKLSELETR